MLKILKFKAYHNFQILCLGLKITLRFDNVQEELRKIALLLARAYYNKSYRLKLAKGKTHKIKSKRKQVQSFRCYSPIGVA